MEKGNEKVNGQKWENITVLELKAALTKSQKWKSPGIDKVPNFWLNTFSSSHVTFTSLQNEIMQNLEETPEWMCEETTYLLAKGNDTKDPKNYPPFTCLSTTYKLLTSVPTDRAYSYLVENDLFPLEQKGSSRGSYGWKDQLMVNKMILENCNKRKRNLSCAWIGYKKTFGSVPHEWILRPLELFKVSPRTIQSISQSNWFSKI